MNSYKSPDRRERGRVVESKGPIIRLLEIGNALIGLLAIVALVVSLTAIHDQVSAIQQERYHAAVDDCLLLRDIVTAAFGPHITQASALINSTLLRNCSVYGKAIENHP